MKKLIFLLIATFILLTACAGPAATPPSLQERILGKWSGAMTNANGGKTLTTWTFLKDGTMTIEFVTPKVAYGATWKVDGNRLNFTTEAQPDKPNYRDVEFVNDDTIKFTKEGITETFTRIKE